MTSEWPRRLLSTQTSKMDHTRTDTVYVAILHLLPHVLGGVTTLCPASSAACRAHCLVHAGRSRVWPEINDGRYRKTRLFVERRGEFIFRLENEIIRLAIRAEREGAGLWVRLNGTSDVDWENLIDMEGHFRAGGVRFWDYTKRIERLAERREWYHIVYSWSGMNQPQCVSALLFHGASVAVPFRVKKGRPLPAEFMGRPVIDGDLHDRRWEDPEGCIVGLRAKGTAWRDTTGFVVDPEGLR